MDSRSKLPPRLLIGLVIIAAVIRLPLAFWPNIIHPDEIFQYLEPAWRMLGHDSIVSWEWRYGMRNWLVPSVLAGPIAVGDWIAPGGGGAFVAPRLIAALASLTTVISAWLLGARVSQTHAIVAGFVAAIWFEFVWFAPHTLSEPLATALILPAALLVTHPSLSCRYLVIGGALLAFAMVVRFQYAPALAVMALVACWPRWRNVFPLIGGGSVALAFCGLADAVNGATPFAWVVANIQQNWLHDRAAAFGVMSADIFIQSFSTMWSIALIVLVPAIICGWRHAPLLMAMAIANIVFHSLVGHKEYRFIYLSVAVFIIVAALGSADWIDGLRARGIRRKPAIAIICAGWAIVSGTLAVTGLMPAYWRNGIDAALIAGAVRHDPKLCGLALLNIPIPTLPGRERLAGRSPIYAFDREDPETANQPTATLRRSAPAFNRLLAPRTAADALPAEYTQGDCAHVGDTNACLFARDGGCDPAAAEPYLLNEVLTRIDR